MDSLAYLCAFLALSSIKSHLIILTAVVFPCSVSLYMGIITTSAGFVGVALGTVVARHVKRVHLNGDALVCAVGILASSPFLYGALVLCEFNMIITWVSN